MMQPSSDSAPSVAGEAAKFRRDRLTWVLYVVAAWFAYLQAAPGLVIPQLRNELDLSYTAGGLQIAAFAAGQYRPRAWSLCDLNARSGGGRCCGRRSR